MITGEKSGHHIEIKSGLAENEQVVTHGNYQLQYISLGGVQEHDDHESEEHEEGHSEDDGHEHDHSNHSH